MMCLYTSQFTCSSQMEKKRQKKVSMSKSSESVLTSFRPLGGTCALHQSTPPDEDWGQACASVGIWFVSEPHDLQSHWEHNKQTNKTPPTTVDITSPVIKTPTLMSSTFFSYTHLGSQKQHRSHTVWSSETLIWKYMHLASHDRCTFLTEPHQTDFLVQTKKAVNLLKDWPTVVVVQCLTEPSSHCQWVCAVVFCCSSPQITSVFCFPSSFFSIQHVRFLYSSA